MNDKDIDRIHLIDKHLKSKGNAPFGPQEVEMLFEAILLLIEEGIKQTQEIRTLVTKLIKSKDEPHD